MATWAEVCENVRAGNVLNSSNDVFTFGKSYQGVESTWFNMRPSNTIDLPVGVDEIGTDVAYTLLDGTSWGLALAGFDSTVGGTSRMRLQLWGALPGDEHSGVNAAGRPVDYISEIGMPNYFIRTLQPNPAAVEIDVTYTISMVSLSLTDVLFPPDLYEGYQTVYITEGRADFLTSPIWKYMYDGSNVEAIGSITGNWFEYWTDLVDILASDVNEAPDYPGSSSSGGGGGAFYNINETIDIPPLPSVQAIDFGMVSIYNPNESEMKAISSWLWSDDYTENIKMNMASPMENILMCALVPLSLFAIPATFKIGNVETQFQIAKIWRQYYELDCGVLNINEFWGNFLDYSASYNIWLPYIGFRSVKPDDFVDGTIGVVYHIDLLTGAAVCFIWTRKDDNIKHVLYTYNGNIFNGIGLSGANYMSLYNQQTSAITSGINTVARAAGQAIGGDFVGAGLSLLTGLSDAKMQYDSAKPDYGRAGNNGSNTGFLSIRYPYLIQSLPISQAPNNYDMMHGSPSMLYRNLQDLHGYTEINAINLDSINASSAEKSELMNIMKSGFYI